jgi:hypothetical protein
MLDKRASADAARNKHQLADLSAAWKNYLFDREFLLDKPPNAYAIKHQRFNLPAAWENYLFEREFPQFFPGYLKRQRPDQSAALKNMLFDYLSATLSLSTIYQIASQIATLARVNDKDRLCDGIHQQLALEWKWYTDGPPKGWQKRIVKDLECGHRLSHELSARLKNIDWMTAALLKKVNIERLISLLNKLTAESVEGLYLIRDSLPKTMGRPSCIQMMGLGSFTQFTLRLLWDVREAGGRLTFEKNMGRGTLTKALEILRPHLPPKFIPNSLPLSTLSDIKQLDKKLAEAKVMAIKATG